MLKLKLQYFGHLMGAGESLEKTLRLGEKAEDRKRVAEGEVAGWRHRLKGHELGQAPGGAEGRGSLVSRGSRGHDESDATEQQQQGVCLPVAGQCGPVTAAGWSHSGYSFQSFFCLVVS